MLSNEHMLPSGHLVFRRGLRLFAIHLQSEPRLHPLKIVISRCKVLFVKIFNASRYNEPKELLKFIVEENGDPSKYCNGMGSTALMAACEWGNIKCVKILLQHNADIHAVSATFRNATTCHAYLRFVPGDRRSLVQSARRSEVGGSKSGPPSSSSSLLGSLLVAPMGSTHTFTRHSHEGT